MATSRATHRAEQAWNVLRAAGARRTVARRMIVDVLAAVDGHLSIADIHRDITATRPEINLSTVHRTVAYLVGQQVAHVLAWPGEARYGLNERPHVHAVCAGCEQVYEIDAETLSDAVRQARKASPITLHDTSWTLVGRCAVCRPDPSTRR